jgi:hypothetical protein
VAGNADHRRPNLFRLTFRAGAGVLSDGTHEWRRIQTIEEARTLADAARKSTTDRPYRVRKQNPSAGSSTITSAGNPHWSTPIPSRGNPHYSHSRETPTTSISRGGDDQISAGQRAARPPQGVA